MTGYEFTSPSMNMGHTCGNVTAYVTDLIQTWFEPNFFRTVNVSTTMAYRYFNILQNKKAEFFKRKKPYLIIQPRINVGGAKFLAGTQLANRINPMFNGGDYGNLQPFIEDKEKGFAVKYLMNRVSMSFDITIIVETQMEQMRLFFYLQNRQIWNLPLNWETALESHVPREMIAAVSSITGISMNEPGHILSYLNSNSYDPLTYKLKGSTGNDEYFRYYQTRIDAELTSLNIDAGNKSGLVDDSYGITFTVDTEFTSAGLYQMLSHEPIPKFWNNGGEAVDIDHEVEMKNKSMYVDMLLTPYRDLGFDVPPGWQIIGNPSYKVTATAPEADVTDISKLIPPKVASAIHYHRSNNIPLDKLITVFALKDHINLDPLKGEVNIDYDELKVYTYKLNKTSTYRLLIVVNVQYLNELIAQQLE